jgi:glycosyltransferase involved in cell wall biosynthesis
VTARAREGSVLLDVQATQSAGHRDRGVARYTAELAAALLARHPGVVRSFLTNPDLAPPGRVEPLVASGRVVTSDRADYAAAEVLHVLSPFELDVPVRRLWPQAAVSQGLNLAVTLYDTIPALFADRYLADPGLRSRYLARVELVRAADAVFAISEQTAADGIERFGLREERVHVVGAAPSAVFARPVARTSARQAARAAVSGLRERFVLYTAGMDDRKNWEGLFRAWALLPESLRHVWQLVLVCGMNESTRNHVEHVARGIGIGDELLLPGYVSDDTLRLLYQSTELFVFPSLYEGYGLPVAEALACGAPTIGSNTSSVRELLVPDAQFDPASDEAIAAAITRGLTDDARRVALREQAARPRIDWAVVADRTVEQYDRILAGPRRPRRAKPLIAIVSPVPPTPSGIAEYTYRMTGPLLRHADVVVFADGERWRPDIDGVERTPKGVELCDLTSFAEQERLRGGFDTVIYCVGNSQFHAGALARLRQRPGIVLAHEVRLTDLYALAVDEPGAVPAGFSANLHAMYGSALPDEVATVGRIAPDTAERLGLLMAREIAALSEHFVVMSEYAARLLRTDLDPADAQKIVVTRFAYGELDGPVTPAAAREPIVAAFGVVNEVKRPGTLIEMLPAVLARVPDAALAIVGRCGEAEHAHLTALAEAVGVADRVTIAGNADEREYRGWMDRAAVAVQLRKSSNGECSAAAGDCLVAGAATVVSAIGAQRELPDAAAVKVPVDIDAANLGAVVADLLADPARRQAMADAGKAFTDEANFETVTAELFTTVIAPNSAGVTSPE